MGYLLRAGLECGLAHEPVLGRALDDALPLVVHEDRVAVARRVDLSGFVVDGSIRLYQHGYRRVERCVVHALGLSLEIGLEADAFGREVFDASGRVLRLQLKEKLLWPVRMLRSRSWYHR